MMNSKKKKELNELKVLEETPIADGVVIKIAISDKDIIRWRLIVNDKQIFGMINQTNFFSNSNNYLCYLFGASFQRTFNNKMRQYIQQQRRTGN